MSIAANLADVHERVRRSCQAAGRDPSTVKLLAASKSVGPERVVEAIEAGHLLFGENRAQELVAKRDAVDAMLVERGISARPEWHYIGHVQTNKVRLLVGRIAMIQTVDRLGAAEAIARRVGLGAERTPLPVLVEVNLAGEATKSGVSPDQVLDLCRQVASFEELDLRGLMAVPPHLDPTSRMVPWFSQLADMATQGRDEGLGLVELSMGMTHDFEVAIAQGTTMIRLGTAIFGVRPPINAPDHRR